MLWPFGAGRFPATSASSNDASVAPSRIVYYRMVSTGQVAEDPQDANTIYIGLRYSGVFKSTDSGKSWSEISRGLTAHDITTLTVGPKDPNTVYASAGNM